MERVGRELAVRYAVIEVLASATRIEEAARTIIAEVCRILGWRAGALWLVDEDSGVLRCATTWTAASGDDFAGVNSVLTFPPGIGIPGQVWSRREPVWIRDVVADTNFPRHRWAERNRRRRAARARRRTPPRARARRRIGVEPTSERATPRQRF